MFSNTQPAEFCYGRKKITLQVKTNQNGTSVVKWCMFKIECVWSLTLEIMNNFVIFFLFFFLGVVLPHIRIPHQFRAFFLFIQATSIKTQQQT